MNLPPVSADGIVVDIILICWARPADNTPAAAIYSKNFRECQVKGIYKRIKIE
jgi:hypothetical protein